MTSREDLDEERAMEAARDREEEIALERPRTDAELARELRLRPAPLRVTRLSRRVLTVLGGTAAVAIAAALVLALWPQTPTGGSQELLATGTRSTPDGLNGLPRDYAGLPKPAPVPQLGPPLPGDLGRPMINTGTPPPGMPQPGPTPGPDPEAQRRDQERAKLAQEREAARTSQLFASAGPQAAAPSSTAEVVPQPAGPATDDKTALARPPTEGDRKLAFVKAEVDRETESPDRIAAPSSPNVVLAGAVIPAALLTGLRSDLPGQITAQVTEPVYDSPTGKVLLIPQGSRLIGEYDAQVQFGQSRALLVWTRLIFPDGRSVTLERQPGADPQGYAGLSDRVDDHWGQLFKAALVSTILSVGAEAGATNEENNLLQAIREGASNASSQTGSQAVSRSLNIQPTIMIRPGFPVRVIVTRDLVFEPYSD